MLRRIGRIRRRVTFVRKGTPVQRMYVARGIPVVEREVFANDKGKLT